MNWKMKPSTDIHYNIWTWQYYAKRKARNKRPHTIYLHLHKRSKIWQVHRNREWISICQGLGERQLCSVTNWMFVPHQIHSNPQSDGIFGGMAFGRYLSLGELMKVETHDKITTLLRRNQRTGCLVFSLPCKDTKRKQPSANHEEGRHQNLTVLAPYLRLPASRTMKNKCLLSKPVSLWYLCYFSLN